jgi:hypothetical protein
MSGSTQTPVNPAAGEGGPGLHGQTVGTISSAPEGTGEGGVSDLNVQSVGTTSSAPEGTGEGGVPDLNVQSVGTTSMVPGTSGRPNTATFDTPPGATGDSGGPGSHVLNVTSKSPITTPVDAPSRETEDGVGPGSYMDVDSPELEGGPAPIKSANQADVHEKMDIDGVNVPAAAPALDPPVVDPPSVEFSVTRTPAFEPLGNLSERPGGTLAGGSITPGQIVSQVAPVPAKVSPMKLAPIKYINGMSSYEWEWEKQQNIERNKKLLTRLKLDDTNEKLFGKEDKENKKGSKPRKPKPAKVSKTLGRRSLRSSGKVVTERSVVDFKDSELMLICPI